MIVLEDPEFEASVFAQDCPLAVPAEITAEEDGGLTLLVYSFCEEIAREFEARFAADPLGDEAIAWLRDKLGEKMLPLGYDECDIESYPLYDYRPDRLDCHAVLPGCEIIASLDGEGWDGLPLDEFALDPADPADRMAVMREDGRIVCYAGINDISEESGCAELTVECEETWRRRGYGASCTALLAEYLLNLGKPVQYVTSHLNEPSVKCAERAGFVRRKSHFPFVFRKSNVDDGEFFDFT
ncbi:MAG: GNAT family N-acetyltransferase [Clostridia bacterium]|nr:GNAT family N-acetyltransferase [Clostridia bacterium]